MRSSVLSISGIALPSRYELLLRLAAGGTATVHVGRLRGIAGFWRLVAVKVAHAHLIEDPAHRETMVEEARLASQIHHPNVVPVIDIDDVDGRMLLVMDYIEGASLADLIAASPTRMPARIAVRVALDACAGLHAAHDLNDASGRSLRLVHRDVSPHNILLGADGVTRLTDFGIAKTAHMRARSGVGALKGKLAYMAPEYVTGRPADAVSDVFGLGVVVWEMLAGRRLFRGENGHETLCNVLHVEAPALSSIVPELGEDLDAVLAIALAKNPSDRFPSAKAFGTALKIAARCTNLIATTDEVAAFVMARVGEQLLERRKRIAEIIAAEREAPGGAVVDVLGTGEQTVSRVRGRSLPSLPSLLGLMGTEGSATILTADMPHSDTHELTAADRDEITRRDVMPIPSVPPSSLAVSPTVLSLPAEEPTGHSNISVSATVMRVPPPQRRRTSRMFLAVALAAFVFGGLVKLVWLPQISGSGPSVAAQPTFAPPAPPARASASASAPACVSAGPSAVAAPGSSVSVSTPTPAQPLPLCAPVPRAEAVAASPALSSDGRAAGVTEETSIRQNIE